MPKPKPKGDPFSFGNIFPKQAKEIQKATNRGKTTAGSKEQAQKTKARAGAGSTRAASSKPATQKQKAVSKNWGVSKGGAGTERQKRSRGK